MRNLFLVFVFFCVIVSTTNAQVPIKSVNQVLGEADDPLLPGAKFVKLRGGSFKMGSPASESLRNDDESLHTVTVTSFEIAKTETTQAQWEKIMGPDENRSFHRDPDRPVELVSWVDTQVFISKLNDRAKKRGLPFRYGLPTEAEWEFAARGGTQSTYSFGNDDSNLGEFAIFLENSNLQTAVVGPKRKVANKPNPYGLYDMHGNVYEWTEDLYRSDYEKLDPINPRNETHGTTRVARGGGWFDEWYDLRSASRVHFGPEARFFNFLGFRVVRRPLPQKN